MSEGTGPEPAPAGADEMEHAMKTIPSLVLVAGLAAGAALPLSNALGAARQEPAKQEKPAIYDEAADARAEVAAAVERAAHDNKRVLVQWGANWCGWCHLLHELCAKDPQVAKELLYEYEVVLVDIGRWDKNFDLADEYGAKIKDNGVPYLTVLDGAGKVLANQETSSLEKKDYEKPAHDPEKVLGFLKSHEATPLVAQDQLDGALAKATKEEKRVFLHFGAPWCGWCRRLEAWMARPEVAALLAKDFVELKIDVDRMKGGKDVMLRYRGTEEGGIPWFCFLDANGESLADSGAGKANLGCPYSPEEIATFGKLLKQVARHLTDEDIAKLQRSLEPPKDAAAGAAH